MARKNSVPSDKSDDTRQRLLLAAGELFAEKGFGDTSVRDIAQKAGANVAAMNYHFSSKENLFLETVRFALARMTSIRRESLAAAPAALSRAAAIQALRALIDRETRSYLSSDIPRWYPQLIVRCVLSKTDALEAIFEQAFRPNHQALKGLIQSACPRLTDEEASLWAYSINGQIVFYSLAREPVLLLRGEKEYSERFLKTVVDHITRVTFSGLRLPQRQARPAKGRTGAKTGK